MVSICDAELCFAKDMDVNSCVSFPPTSPGESFLEEVHFPLIYNTS